MPAASTQFLEAEVPTPRPVLQRNGILPVVTLHSGRVLIQIVIQNLGSV